MAEFSHRQVLSCFSESWTFLSLSSISLSESLTASLDPPDNNPQDEDNLNWNEAASLANPPDADFHETVQSFHCSQDEPPLS